jgi:hypothetical protein
MPAVCPKMKSEQQSISDRFMTDGEFRRCAANPGPLTRSGAIEQIVLPGYFYEDVGAPLGGWQIYKGFTVDFLLSL